MAVLRGFATSGIWKSKNMTVRDAMDIMKRK